MNLFFLDADQPITKRYSLDGTTLVKHPYPFVYNVTSHLEPVASIKDFHQAILRHSKKGRTLVKGELHEQLTKQSRAGATQADDKTSWICLDLDGIDRFQTVDLFLERIGCGDTDYILQWSSSMNVENKSGFRCHIFMLLRAPIHPQLLKYWLQGLNLNIPELSDQLTLTKTHNALRWPLDVTTCQNDKLLYIAPPIFDAPLLDPFPGNNRISLVTKKQRFLETPLSIPTREAVREATHKIINNLRVEMGMPKRRSTNFKYAGTTEYLAKPDTAVITEMRTERGFVYFNLNGGDSWAYYHPEDNPAFIHNFKGEPTYRTEDLLPEYWAQLQATQRSNNYQPNASGLIYLAFRDFDSSTYYNGIYDVFQDDLKLSMAKSEGQLRHFMKQHNQLLGDYIPDWSMVYDPENRTVVDPERQILNTYRPSACFKISKPPALTTIPPIIDKVINHVMGDVANVDHFLNWLACIVQFYDRTGTAWVLHGVPGTGKGVLFHQILSPMFGEWNTEAKRMEEIEGDFTGFMKNKFILFVDEVEAGRSLYHSKVTAKLKNLIAEPFISIREMYRPSYMYRNRINIIFASNKNAPVEIDPKDRRFNVAVRQETRLPIDAAEIDQIPFELPSFYAFLKHYPADRARAREPLVSAARTSLIQTNRLAIDTMADVIIQGQLETLWDYLPSEKPVMTGMISPRMVLYTEFRRILVDLVTNQPVSVSRDELYTLFQWCIGSMPESPNKFTALLRHHRIYMESVWRNGRTVRGIKTTWSADSAWLANAQAEIASGAV